MRRVFGSLDSHLTHQTAIENAVFDWLSVRRSIQITVRDLKLGYLDGVLRIKEAELQPLSNGTNVISDKP